MNFYLENSVLKITINSKGAELISLYNKETQLEYMWSGDADFWPKTSPVLFPIVGGLKNNEYSFEGKKYNLTRHGFARENEHEVMQIDATKIVFTLKSNEATIANYPFYFIFSIEYSLKTISFFANILFRILVHMTCIFLLGHILHLRFH